MAIAFYARQVTIVPGRLSTADAERVAEFYTCFNERRFADAAADVANDALIERLAERTNPMSQLDQPLLVNRQSTTATPVALVHRFTR